MVWHKVTNKVNCDKDGTNVEEEAALKGLREGLILMN